MKDLLKERERGEEAEHFHREDAKLIEKMRERARLTEIAQALASKLRVDEAELLRRVVELGLNQDTGAAILLAPLVQVAWADGGVNDTERQTVIDLAASRGLTPGMPAHDKLLEWLRQRPSDGMFEAALEVMRVGFSVLPADERDERIRGLVAACHRVAEASGSTLGRLLGAHDGVTGDESAVLDAIATKLRAVPRSPA
jgi:tellurite resistance protein